ncbi:MAG: alpha-galactosidase [Acutalibacteraceae bacterium]
MPISFCEKNSTFYLTANQFSYVFKIDYNNRLIHLYAGRKISAGTDLSHLFYPYIRGFSPVPYDLDDFQYSPDIMPLEYSSFGNGDFHSPAFEICYKNGSSISDMKYTSHKIIKGKPPLEGLPCTTENDGKCETLVLTLTDAITGISAELFYTVFENLNVITRHTLFKNHSENPVSLNRAMSLSVDFDRNNYQVLSLYGSHCRERNIEISPLRHGTVAVESRRGASSHQLNPFIALLSEKASEDSGEVFGFNLVYSGNHLMQVEVDQFDTVRVLCGINPFQFSWDLAPGESFTTPECVMVFSDQGLGGMSRVFHDLYRNHLGTSKFISRKRPVVINSWEAAYFNFDQEKICEIIESSANLGIDTFVLDDGWFEGRNDDTSSLGDWTIDRKKLPDGFDIIIKKCRECGMSFGLWFEPEMISKHSNLFKTHPDWAIYCPDRKHTTGRHQLTLDLSNSEVCDYIIDCVSDILKKYDITYVKWDMNKHITDFCSSDLDTAHQKELPHRYMLGLYHILDVLTTSFPDVLFESCSGGGGRFDAGMLYYMPQTWTSDNTDAIARLKIQFGTSIVYPPSSMSGHVSAVPNHQNGRITPFSTRGLVAMACAFGYELNPKLLSDEERSQIKEQTELYEQISPLVLKGDFYRLIDPFKENECAFEFVSKDKTNAFAVYVLIQCVSVPPIRRMKFKGLDESFTYFIPEISLTATGEALMNAGISLPPLSGDYGAVKYTIVKCQEENK